MEQYVSALLREASQRAPLISEPLKTIYIGGGTPSLLPPDLLKRLLESLGEIMDFSSVVECSVEANPGTVTEKWLEKALECGVNRISFGVQATQDYLLRTLGRIHCYAEVIQSVETARRCGFRNINADLIFGIPGQSMEDWQHTIGQILELAPMHISAYGLIPEKGTPLFRRLQEGFISLPEPDLEREMYDTAIALFQDTGFRQYEISNFARPGFECRHNIGYWDQIPYIGIGLSAASMIRSCNQGSFSIRWTNPVSFDQYYELTENPYGFEKNMETISVEDARFETVMLSLRMTKGMNRGRFRELHGNVPEYWYGSVLSRLERMGLLELKDDSWRLTRRGMDIQNSVLLEFME